MDFDSAVYAGPDGSPEFAIFDGAYIELVSITPAPKSPPRLFI